MENNKHLSFVKNGVIRLPPGFRFHPTDEELVVQYLKRKVFASPLPASIIPDHLNVCKQDPWNLPGDLEHERYFFSTREAKYPNGNRPNRATCCGYWKATGNDKKIVAFRSNQIVGMKKTLVFYTGKPSNATRTDWIMHEYRLVEPGTTQASNVLRMDQSPCSLMQIGDWVLCRIFLKNRNSRNEQEINEPCKEKKASNVMEMDTKPGLIDFMMQAKMDQSPCSSSCSSSASSGLTEEVSSTREYSCSSSSSSHEGDNQT